MIAKQVSLRSARKSDFGDLVRYITDAQGKLQRVGAVVVTNCTSDNPMDAAIEVRLTQQKNTRSGADKTYHLVISFRVGEQPSADVLQAIEHRLCEGLGFGDHQRVSASHHDTDNLHVHIAINKVHPTRYTVHAPYYDHTTLGKLCEELETTYGLQSDNHAAQQQVVQSRAVEMEKHAGVESLVGWVQRECLDRMKSAGNWAELHEILSEHGLELKARANGFILMDRDGHHAKASSVDRSLSKTQLEKRLGPFEHSDPSPNSSTFVIRTHYEKQPVPSKVDTSALYARYQHEREQMGQTRAAETLVLRQRQAAQLELLRSAGGFQRAAIGLMGGSRQAKKALYALAARARKADFVKLREQHRQERQFLRTRYTRQGWAPWLKARVASQDPEALGAVAVCRDRSGGDGKVWTADPSAQKPTQDQDAWTSLNTYHRGDAAIRDDGGCLQVARGAGPDTIGAALRIAVGRYGQRIRVDGSDEFKTRVIAAAMRSPLPVRFADAALEQRRQALSTTTSQELKNDNPERQRVNAGGVDDSQPGAAHDHQAWELEGRSHRPRSNLHVPFVGGGGTVSSSASPSAGADASRPAQRRKPDVGRVGGEPPPGAKNRLRNLSQLGLVQLARGGAVLLPGDVPGRLEQPDAQSDHALRRPVPRAAGAVAAENAIAKFIAERNLRRSLINDIPKYERYTNADESSGTYAGTRSVNGQLLALLKRADKVDVLPVDAATALKLKRLRIGDAVSVQTRDQKQSIGGQKKSVDAPTYTFKAQTRRKMTPKKGRSQ